jgi:hypothetical protein
MIMHLAAQNAGGTCCFARFLGRHVLGANHSAESGLADAAVAQHNNTHVLRTVAHRSIFRDIPMMVIWLKRLNDG